MMIKKVDVPRDLLLYFKKFSKQKITLDTTINNDLMFVGSDALYLIDYISENYDIDFSCLNFDDFFLSDFKIPFQYTYYKLFKKELLKKKDVSIRHLVRVIEAGKWFDP